MGSNKSQRQKLKRTLPIDNNEELQDGKKRAKKVYTKSEWLKVKHKFVGVDRRSGSGRYYCRICDPLKKKRYSIGTFDTPEEALHALNLRKEKIEEVLIYGVPELEELHVEKKEVEKRFFGVYRKKSTGKFVARINDPFEKKQVWLGSFGTAEEANEAYQSRKREIEELGGKIRTKKKVLDDDECVRESEEGIYDDDEVLSEDEDEQKEELYSQEEEESESFGERVELEFNDYELESRKVDKLIEEEEQGGQSRIRKKVNDDDNVSKPERGIDDDDDQVMSDDGEDETESSGTLSTHETVLELERNNVESESRKVNNHMKSEIEEEHGEQICSRKKVNDDNVSKPERGIDDDDEVLSGEEEDETESWGTLSTHERVELEHTNAESESRKVNNPMKIEIEEEQGGQICTQNKVNDDNVTKLKRQEEGSSTQEEEETDQSLGTLSTHETVVELEHNNHESESRKDNNPVKKEECFVENKEDKPEVGYEEVLKGMQVVDDYGRFVGMFSQIDESLSLCIQ